MQTINLSDPEAFARIFSGGTTGIARLKTPPAFTHPFIDGVDEDTSS